MPRLHDLKTAFEHLLFSGRWLLPTFYLGLAISLALLLDPVQA
jgi:uncharacterized membrane protein YqhA